MTQLDRLRRPGYAPRKLRLPQGLQRLLHANGLSLLQLREMTRKVELRPAVRRAAGITEAELKRALADLERLFPKIDASLSAAPVQVPPLGGMVRPDHRRFALGAPPVPPFGRTGAHALPRNFDHLDLFRYKPVIAQRGPDCVGHACRNATEVQHNICDRHLSGLFAWEFAMKEAGYPIPPGGTWPAVVLKGAVERGICSEDLCPEENYREDTYFKPSSKTVRDAARYKLETFVELRSAIGEPDTVDLMCTLLHGSERPKLKGRVLVIGVGVPEEWLTAESLLTGVRPVPLSTEPVGGHSFVIVGYFHHHDQLWFIGLDNWGDRVGSHNPFGYPKNMGLVFIPAQFFRDPKWFWDLAITATHAEAKQFDSHVRPRAAPSLARRDRRPRWSHIQVGLGTAAGILAILRSVFPGNWW